MAASIFVATWTVLGLAMLVWSFLVPVTKDYAECVRRHELATRAFIPWMLAGCTGVAAFLFASS
jgi:hypothetical protein